MAFERLKGLLGGGKDAGSSKLLRAALRPVEVVDAPLFERCVAYVHDGSGPELLMELEASRAPQATKVLLSPGVIGWAWLHDDALRAKLVAAGFPQHPVDAIRKLRHDYYASDAPLAELIRLGRLFTCLGDGPNRVVEGVPTWLTALLNDVGATGGAHRTKPLADSLPRWTPDRVRELARLGGVAEPDLSTVVFGALFQDAGYAFQAPASFAGVDDFLITQGATLPADAAAKLCADGRVGLAERAQGNPAIASALAPMLARLATEKAKTVRVAAVKALDAVPGDVLAAALAPVLVKVPASQGAEIVEYLSRTDAGAALLADAVAAGAKLSGLVDKAEARRAAVQAAPAASNLVIPPYASQPEPDNAAAIIAEIRRSLDKAIAAGVGATDKWKKDGADKARKVSDADLRELVDVARGVRQGQPKLLKMYNLWWLGEQAPSLTMTQLIRLEKQEKRTNPAYAIRHRVTEETDLRAIAEAVERAGLSRDAIDVAMFGRQSSYWGTSSPEVAWPWFAEHVGVLQEWLVASPSDAVDALAILDAFPALPPELLPSLATLAASSSRTTRPLAQALLAKHGLAFELAVQSLADGKGEVRAAAASWLASVGDAKGVPALRARLKKERSEVARAAMLAALESLGDDIAPDLAPKVLLAEAQAGLKKKTSAGLAWLNLNLLPAVVWADGTPVDPQIVRWWVVLADKMRVSDGSGLIDRYVSLLDAESAATLGRFALATWVAQDTRHPTEDESRAHAAVEGPRRWQTYQNWLRHARANKQTNTQYIEEAAAIPVEKHIADAYAEHQGTYVGSAAANRGLLALTTRMPGIELANAVQSYIRNHGGRRAQVDALMYPLYANGQPAAIQLLLGVSRRFKQKSVQETAAKLVQALAEQRGWTADELADRTIPSAGFGDDRLLRLSFGKREFLGRVTPEGGIELSTTEGKPIKALPAPRADEDAATVKEAKAALTTARKELKSVLAMQTARLFEAMCAARTWAASDWNEYLASHPLVGQLVTRLVWLENPGPAQQAFRPSEDGVLLDLDDEPVDLAPDARVGLAHRVTVGEEASASWRAHLADYGVTPLFDQFGHAAPTVPATATELDDLKGHMTDTFTFRGVATKRGYTRGAAEDGGCFYEYTKQFGSAGLVAVLGFTGSYLPEENVACATTTLSFRRGRRAVALGEVPEILLAECYGDYQAMAALGPFDADWEKKAAL